METLALYAHAILAGGDNPRILGRERHARRWRERDCEVSLEECVYRFANGVVIQRSVEQDDYPGELACAECWIGYQVLELGESPGISPMQKTFDNACRESWWLAYHAAPGV
ncbi:hypothetical protein [Chromobacterium sphagni]|uniref:Uncharacterized protein n=1 Tax=Chromobacterium sphagni TaxID=1903179 RepID=A0A1S1X3V7_9NEIS|nr:hypothetical protein [Chromobacterium sphagni]OHX14110.1 hypothetical protein BI347_11780 [Chromobacterium sphagni]OHX20319.1 hypothetical protein BI344_07480 [Chromobacterium sphagni]